MRLAVALKRASGESPPSGWPARVGDIKGVHVIGESKGRLLVDVDDEAARRRLERTLGTNWHIEPLFSHQPSGD